MLGRRSKEELPRDPALGPCDRHSFDHAAGTCGRCGANFCEVCLVFPFGPRKAPYCIPCALVAAGVRR